MTMMAMRINPQLVVALATGSLAGSIFTWFMNRPQNTVLTYAISTTTLGADATVKGLIPDLRIQIGGDEIPVVHTHTISIEAQEGPYLESADVAVMFDAPIRVFGKLVAEAPSPLQKIDCTDVDRNGSITCKLSRLATKKGQYRIAIATDRKNPPKVVMVARNADAIRADVYLANASRIFGFERYNVFQIVLTLVALVPIVIMSLKDLSISRSRARRDQDMNAAQKFDQMIRETQEKARRHKEWQDPHG